MKLNEGFESEKKGNSDAGESHNSLNGVNGVAVQAFCNH